MDSLPANSLRLKSAETLPRSRSGMSRQVWAMSQNSENIIMDRRSKMAQGAAPGQSKQAPDARRCSLCRYSWAALWQLSCRILYFHQIVFH